MRPNCRMKITFNLAIRTILFSERREHLSCDKIENNGPNPLLCRSSDRIFRYIEIRMIICENLYVVNEFLCVLRKFHLRIIHIQSESYIGIVNYGFGTVKRISVVES